jgi:hypothetical protein
MGDLCADFAACRYRFRRAMGQKPEERHISYGLPTESLAARICLHSKKKL